MYIFSLSELTIKYSIVMGAAALPVILFTLIWAGVAGSGYFVPPGPHQRVIQVCLLLTGACCWLIWLCCYMAQMNPLIGPEVDAHARAAMKFYWGGLHG